MSVQVEQITICDEIGTTESALIVIQHATILRKRRKIRREIACARTDAVQDHHCIAA
jgi:hypothetical protein